MNELLNEWMNELLNERKKMTNFWVVAPCSLVNIDRRFRGAYCLLHHGNRTDVVGSKYH
jgi:hypothetical protein